MYYWISNHFETVQYCLIYLLSALQYWSESTSRLLGLQTLGASRFIVIFYPIYEFQNQIKSAALKIDYIFLLGRISKKEMTKNDLELPQLLPPLPKYQDYRAAPLQLVFLSARDQTQGIYGCYTSSLPTEP